MSDHISVDDPRYNYLDTLPGVKRVVILEYLKSDKRRREMLRLHNPDIDFDEVEEQEKQDEQI